MRKHRPLPLLAATAMALVFSACGGSSGTTEVETGNPDNPGNNPGVTTPDNMSKPGRPRLELKDLNLDGHPDTVRVEFDPYNDVPEGLTVEVYEVWRHNGAKVKVDSVEFPRPVMDPLKPEFTGHQIGYSVRVVLSDGSEAEEVNSEQSTVMGPELAPPVETNLPPGETYATFSQHAQVNSLLLSVREWLATSLTGDGATHVITIEADAEQPDTTMGFVYTVNHSDCWDWRAYVDEIPELLTASGGTGDCGLEHDLFTPQFTNFVLTPPHFYASTRSPSTTMEFVVRPLNP